VIKRVDTALIEGLQEARGGALKASTEWRDQTIELGAKIARLETDKAEILRALAMMACATSRATMDCDCGLGPVTCIGI
jgi:predicted RNA polymerase sigma factor